MLLTGGHAGEAGMYPPDAPVTPQDNGRRVDREVDQLRQLLGGIVVPVGPRHQDRELDAVAPDEGEDTWPGNCKIRVVLEEKTNDLQAYRMELLVELDQERRFVVAIRAPAPTDGQHHHPALKRRIRVRDHLPVEIRSGEMEA